MNDACAAFRADWLSAGYDLAHLEACTSCQEWVKRCERSIQALGELPRVTAPAELGERLQRELSGDRSQRLERALTSLPRLAAPALLEGAVAEQFEERLPVGDAARGERAAQALRALDVVSAPAVLERLVNEELARPEQHRVERFPGNLARLSAPEELEEKLTTSVRRRAFLRLLRGPLVALTAAAVVLWIALQDTSPAKRAYRFEVVHATSLDGLDPLARGLAESLTGGAQ